VVLEVPDGWELTGEYRIPKVGEHYISGEHSFTTGMIYQCGSSNLYYNSFIVRKVWEWPSELFDDSVTYIRYSDGQWWRYCKDRMHILMLGIKWTPPTENPKEGDRWDRPKLEG
jgi:hypothetical protein